MARRGVAAVARSLRATTAGGSSSRGRSRGASRSPPARRGDRRRRAVRRRPVRLRRGAVAAAALPGPARRPDPGHQAGRPVRRAARGRRPVRAPMAPVLGRLRRRLLRAPGGRRPRDEDRARPVRARVRPVARRADRRPGVGPAGAALPRDGASPSWPTHPSSRPGSASTRRPRTRSFILDRHPGFDNVWIAGGGSGHGFKHGPVIGRYLVTGSPGRRRGREEARFGPSHERVANPNMRTGADGMVQAWADWYEPTRASLGRGARRRRTASGPRRPGRSRPHRRSGRSSPPASG